MSAPVSQPQPLPPADAVCVGCGHDGASHHDADIACGVRHDGGTGCWAPMPQGQRADGSAGPAGLCECRAFVPEELGQLRAELAEVVAEVERFGIYGAPVPAVTALVKRADELVTENARLKARVAELEAAPVLVCRECAAPVQWVNNANGGWWNHASPAADGHAVYPKPAEDPCRPCGCPKRFDRHADGCPVDDPNGLHHPYRLGRDLPEGGA